MILDTFWKYILRKNTAHLLTGGQNNPGPPIYLAPNLFPKDVNSVASLGFHNNQDNQMPILDLYTY